MGLTYTFQTRIEVEEDVDHALTSYTKLMSTVEHTLFADAMADRHLLSLKNGYLKRFGITARQFNACRTQIEGKIASLKELQAIQIRELKEKISFLKIALEKKKFSSKKYFYKKRRLEKLQFKLMHREREQEKGRVSLCFGTKKLFSAQNHLDKSGFTSRDEWKLEWEKKRTSECFMLGSKDETGGNQSCTAYLQQDRRITLRIRLPDALISNSRKYVVIEDVYFQYGHDKIVRSLQECARRKETHKNGKEYKHLGQAISYRLKKDGKGWRIFASTSIEKPKQKTRSEGGVIGADINVGHVAVVETDRFGNTIDRKNFPFNLNGKSKEQSRAIIGDLCKNIVSFALEKGKDLVLENLDFRKKRLELKETTPLRLRRLFSSFSYEKILSGIRSRATRFGVGITHVNPAYTSLIGRIKFAKRYGQTIHQSAAQAIARRYYRFSERPPTRMEEIPDGKGGHVAFPSPVRKRGNHVWSYWALVRKKLQVVLAAHFRAARGRSSDPPLRRSLR